MAKKCVYCGKENVSFTKEHIYPNWLYQVTPEQNLQYLPSGEVAETQLTIKDVCSKCNNGKLSELDNYFHKLYELYVSKFVHPGEVVDFEYDFDLLARWLLKVSYNSARAAKTNQIFLSKFTDYILYGINRPDGLSIFVQLIIPYELTKTQMKTIPHRDKLLNNEILPTQTHAGEYVIRRGNNEFHPGRVFAVNSFHFFILLQPENVPEKFWKKFLVKWPSQMSGVTQLHRMKHRAHLKASDVNALMAYGKFARQTKAAIQTWRSKKKVQN